MTAVAQVGECLAIAIVIESKDSSKAAEGSVCHHIFLLLVHQFIAVEQTKNTYSFSGLIDKARYLYPHSFLPPINIES